MGWKAEPSSQGIEEVSVSQYKQNSSERLVRSKHPECRQSPAAPALVAVAIITIIPVATTVTARRGQKSRPQSEQHLPTSP